MTKQSKSKRVSGWHGYIITVFAITVAVGYGPVARRWLILQGIDEYSAGVWAALSGLAVAAAGAWLIAAARVTFTSILENLSVEAKHRELAEIASEFDGIDDEKLRQMWRDTQPGKGLKMYSELKRRGYFSK